MLSIFIFHQSPFTKDYTAIMALRRALLQASACRLVALHHVQPASPQPLAHHMQRFMSTGVIQASIECLLCSRRPPPAPSAPSTPPPPFFTEAAANAAMEDTLRPKVLRVFAFIMVCGAGLRILPLVAASAVGNTLALLEAQQPFMVKAGCSRLQLLMRLEAGMAKAVEEGAAPRLLRLIPPLQQPPQQPQQPQQQPEVDEGEGPSRLDAKYDGLGSFA